MAYPNFVHGEHTVTGFEGDDAGVTVVVRRPDGSSARIDACYVVGCDGVHSTVRQQAGIGFAGSRYAESFALADVHMDWPLSRREVHLFFAPAGLVVVAPLPDDRYRIVATVDQAPEHPALADVQALLDTRGPARRRSTVRDVVWRSRFQVHHRLADTYRHGRVLLAGDAAPRPQPRGRPRHEHRHPRRDDVRRDPRRRAHLFRPRRRAGRLRSRPQAGRPGRDHHDTPAHPGRPRPATRWCGPCATSDSARPDTSRRSGGRSR